MYCIFFDIINFTIVIYLKLYVSTLIFEPIIINMLNEMCRLALTSPHYGKKTILGVGIVNLHLRKKSVLGFYSYSK